MVIAAMMGLLTSCSAPSVHDSALLEAELGIAYEVRFLGNQLRSAAADDFPLPSDFMDKWGVALLLTDEKQNVEGVARTLAVYDFAETEENVVLHVFAPSAASTSRGIETGSADLFGCGSLTMSRATGSVRISDDKCPSWILGWNADDAQEISLSRITKKYEVEGES